MAKTNDNAKENKPALWRLPKPEKAHHKYDRGHALIFGGKVMTGASRLSAMASLRIGAGLATLAVPEKVWPVYAASMLSVIVRPLEHVRDWQALLEDERINALLIGPGAGTGAFTRQTIEAALESKKPLVLDADALHLLAAEASLRKQLGKQVLLTPHEGEYARLAKALRLDTAASKIARAATLAKELGVTVLLKGEETIITDGKRHVVNRHATPFLATAGTGDVLAGMITGLIAQKMDPFDAACAAAWLHGEAGRQLGRGLIAEDLLAALPHVLQRLSK